MRSSQSFRIAIKVLLISILTLLHTATAFSLENNKMGPFCLNVKLALRPDQREEFLTIIKEDQKQSLATEPGCVQFVVGEDTTTPNIFYLHEEYKNEAGFQAHTETPHFAKWNEFCDTKPWSNDDGPVVTFYHGTHETQTWPTPDYAYCLNVDLYPKPEVRDAFLKVIAANKKGTDDNEPLCLQYVYGESTSVPNAFHFHEQYIGKEAGKEGFEAHASSPHFADWEAFASTGEPFSKPPVVSFFKTI